MKKFHPWLRFLVWKDSLTMSNAAFLMRRPHRSFKRTMRRDYARSLKLPGYWKFTGQVWGYLWSRKKVFGLLVVVYSIVSLLLGGVTNQDSYQEISELINQSAGEVLQGAWGTVGQAGVLLVSAFLTPNDLSSEQQIFLGICAVFLWLTTVWLLREMMAGRNPRLRDGLYSSGSPIAASLLVLMVGVLQLLPIALIALAYAGLSTVGLLDEGLGMMIIGTLAALTATLSLYWMTPTFIALVVVTLPGMYPFRALRAAGDIVVGRRLRILYRILWLLLTIVIAWVSVMIPVVLLDTALKNALPAIAGLPIVPIFAAFMGSISAVWAAAYVYLLYRRIVDDDANPA